MTIVFLLLGLPLFLLGLFFIFHEISAILGTHKVWGNVLGYENSNDQSPPYKTVVQFIGSDGHSRLVVSSVPTHLPLAVPGEKIAVRLKKHDPQFAVTEYGSHLLSGFLFLALGCGALLIFMSHFVFDIFSIGTASAIAFLLSKSMWRSFSGQDSAAFQRLNISWRKASESQVHLANKDLQINWAKPSDIHQTLQAWQKSMRRVPPVSLGLGLILLALTFQAFKFESSFIIGSEHALGWVSEIEYRQDRVGGIFTPIIEFRNVHTGSKQNFRHKISDRKLKYQPGDAVDVLFDPNNPKQAQLDLGIWNYQLSILSGLTAFFFLWIGLWATYIKRRIDQQSHFVRSEQIATAA